MDIVDHSGDRELQHDGDKLVQRVLARQDDLYLPRPPRTQNLPLDGISESRHRPHHVSNFSLALILSLLALAVVTVTLAVTPAGNHLAKCDLCREAVDITALEGVVSTVNEFLQAESPLLASREDIEQSLRYCAEACTTAVSEAGQLCSAYDRSFHLTLLDAIRLQKNQNSTKLLSVLDDIERLNLAAVDALQQCTLTCRAIHSTLETPSTSRASTFHEQVARWLIYQPLPVKVYQEELRAIGTQVSVESENQHVRQIADNISTVSDKVQRGIQYAWSHVQEWQNTIKTPNLKLRKKYTWTWLRDIIGKKDMTALILLEQDFCRTMNTIRTRSYKSHVSGEGSAQ